LRPTKCKDARAEFCAGFARARRYVVFVGDGREIGIPKTEADSRNNLQRPQVFYRRELDANPLIIGVGNKE
jgi:hypothetical protein